MSTAFLTSSAVSGINIDLTTGEDLFIGPNATRVSTDSIAIRGLAGGHAVDILGDVYGEVAGIEMGEDGQFPGDSRVTVAEGGSVTARVIALIANDMNFTLSNHGFMSGNDGVTINGGSVDLFNAGTISGSFGDGIFADSNGGLIVNRGTIEGNQFGDGIVLRNTASAFNNLAEVVNYGVISGDDDAVSALTDNDLILYNHGQLQGNVDSFSGDDRVVNTGIITGDVDLDTGNDVYDGRGGTVTGIVFGGSGDDLFILDDPTTEIVELGVGEDTVRINTDYVLGGGIEVLELVGGGDLRGEGNALDNRITAGIGDDTLSGGQGNDTLTGGFGADLLDGGDGTDEVSYDDSQGWVNVSLLTGFVGGGAGSHAVGDSFVSIENITGSDHDDRLNGDNGANILAGGNGDDILRGRGGADDLVGNLGSDTADYADSAAWVNVSLMTGFTGGGTGNHAIGDTFSSIENLTGSNFADRLNGDDNDNVLEGRAGADTIDGNDGIDTLSYASSAGFVNVSLLTGFTGGGSGSHALGDVLSDMENVIGSRFDDLLSGDNFANVIEGGAGNDSLRGNNGADTFVFADGFGQDTVADFADGSDIFDFTEHSGVGAFGDLAVTTSGADAIITDPNGNSITVTGGAGLIDAGDFVL